MLGWFKRLFQRPQANPLTFDQLKALAVETNRFIEVWWDDGRYIRIWEPGRQPEDREKWKYF
jgi:hypothetical protein